MKVEFQTNYNQPCTIFCSASTARMSESTNVGFLVQMLPPFANSAISEANHLHCMCSFLSSEIEAVSSS